MPTVRAPWARQTGSAKTLRAYLATEGGWQERPSDPRSGVLRWGETGNRVTSIQIPGSPRTLYPAHTGGAPCRMV